MPVVCAAPDKSIISPLESLAPPPANTPALTSSAMIVITPAVIANTPADALLPVPKTHLYVLKHDLVAT